MSGEGDATGALRLEVTGEPAEADLANDLRGVLLAHPVVRSRYPSADLWIVRVDELDKRDAGPVDPEEGEGEFRALLADLAGNDTAEAFGRLSDPYSVTVTPTARPRMPGEEEHAWAVGLIREADTALAGRIDAGEVEVYRPVPPLADLRGPDGSVQRAVAVGLREHKAGGGARHRMVAVRSDDGEVLDRAPGLPEPSDRDCGGPPGAECGPPAGPERARVRLWRDEEVLWDLVVVRPSASSGVNGSGVELRAVDHRGLRVLHRAHLPVVTVAHDRGDGAYGPTARAWLNEEACFEAEGDDPVPGFRVCSAPPRTVLETGSGGGGHRGVALWLDGEDLVVLSQISAGWYRYVSEWRLGANGTIRPRLGVGAVSNPCTCEPHTHHAYWRLDFDILGGEPNLVQEYNEPNLPGYLAPWHTVRFEVARRRDPSSHRQWRVRSSRSPHGYTIVPGAEDGTADPYGAGDVWILRYHGTEIDDGQGFSTDPHASRAQLDRFVSGELVEREDVVVWYGAHVRGDPGAGAPPGSRVGPDLEPFSWKPRAAREPYVPLVPPSMEGPDDDADWDDDEEE